MDITSTKHENRVATVVSLVSHIDLFTLRVTSDRRMPEFFLLMLFILFIADEVKKTTHFNKIFKM